MAQHLADEERVAVGLIAQGVRQLYAVGVHAVTGDGLQHREDLSLRQPAEIDALDTGLSSQRGER